MAQLPAFAVDGGRVPAAMLRRELWATTSGSNGIVGIHDFKVTPLPTPGAGVSISRGGAIATTRVTGPNAQESYLMAQDSGVTLSIPPVSNARTLHVIARIDDWHFTGNPAPDNPLDAVYWAFSLVTTLSGITYPYVPLARLDIPAGSSTITDAMITDLREVANPRRLRYLRTFDLGPGDTLTTREVWPDSATQTIFIPEWATQAHVRTEFVSVRVPANSTRTGFLWGQLGIWQGRTVRFGAPGVPVESRHTYVAAGDVEVRASIRNQDVRITSWGEPHGGSGGYLVLDGNSAVVFDVEFHETPV